MEVNKVSEIQPKNHEGRKHGQEIMKIKVKTMNGTLYEIMVNPKKTIRNMQIQIQNKTQVPVNMQRLLYKGVLLHSNKMVEEYRIEEGCCLLLVANKIPSQISQHSSIKQSQRIRITRYTQHHNKYKKHRILQQRTNGFQIRQEEAMETLKQNKHTIDQLLSCLNCNFLNDNPFHLQNRKLEVGEWVDIQDSSGEWIEGQIVDIYADYVALSFNGWNNQHNQWVSIKSPRIAPFRSHTIQTEKCKYLSPFPTYSRQLNGIKNPNFQSSVQTFMQDLVNTLQTLNKLLKQLQFNDQKKQDSLQSESPMKSSINHHHQGGSQAFKNKDEIGVRQIQKYRLELEKMETKQNKQPLIDNISNKCEDDMSNKCENDDISNKSFKSKRSEGLVDTASMKSLIIQQSRRKQNKVFYDHTQAQSVRSMKPKDQIRRHYVYNQENILQQEDSQYNEEYQDYVDIGKKQWKSRIHASQLAPIFDRMGRLLIDLAPHAAIRGNMNQLNPNFNENLSTFTNEGSLQSRIAQLSQQAQQRVQNHPSNCQFQIPVMLTPIQIIRLNRLIEEENRNLMRD